MAVFRLALLLGKTIDELDITYDEFMHWQAYLRLEPPEQPANQRLAVLLAQITNMSGKALKEGKTVKPEDFLGESRQQTMQDQIAFFKSLSKD